MRYRIGLFCLLPALVVTAVAAYDLTADRGELAASLKAGSSSEYDYYVFNVGSDNWGPVDNCNTTWAKAQWRGTDGKRLGAVVAKPVDQQTDFNPITNGWFTPNDPDYQFESCGGSHISRGWDDIYFNEGPGEPSSNTTMPTFHVKLDPDGVNFADENPTNNESWLTTFWDANLSLFVPMENIDISSGTTTLSDSDSLFYGAYSTNSANGNITIINRNRSNYLTDGNEKMGFQGRRMNVTLTGGAKNTYTVKNGSKVTAEFLGQNLY